MLLRADVLEYGGAPTRRVRVLWLGPVDEAFVIDLDAPKALPVPAKQSELREDLKQERARLVNDAHLPRIIAESSLTEDRKKRRDDAWDSIQAMVQDEPAIFIAENRSAYIQDAEKNGVASRVTLYERLRRFWKRGLTKNALLLDTDRCGGRGKRKSSKAGSKRGRPRLYGDLPGLNVTTDTRQTFQISVDRFYASSPKFTKQGAYDYMLKTFFQTEQIDTETGQSTHVLADACILTGPPSFAQFIYWLDQDHLAPVLLRKRMGNARYDKDLRALLGTSNAEVWGPGSRFQIDATVADVYLVSRINRRRVIGRPTLYVVIDVFSRLIVGIYVGLENASWVGAMMALSNAAEDKVAFCRRFGRKITADMWPACHLPATLLGDGGEISTPLINQLASAFNVSVETAAAYRADWKGIVERRFNLLQAIYKPYTPGYVDVDYKVRGGNDYRYDAVLDIDEFVQIIIESVLYFNNCHELKHYDRDRKVAADGVPAIPVDLWEWGLEHRSGGLRRFPHEHVQFALMPQALGTVTEHGIRFHDSYYTAPEALKNLWFDRARQSGNWQVPLSYDSRSVDHIFLHTARSKLGFEVGTLTERSRAHRGLSLSEVQQMIRLLKHDQANRLVDRQLAHSDLVSHVESIVDKAKKKQSHSTDSAMDVGQMRESREEEKRADRTRDAFRPGVAPPRAAPPAPVIPLPGVSSTASAENYDEPGIGELWNQQDTPL